MLFWEKCREFPGDPVVIRTWHFHCQGSGLVPDRGTKILYTMRLSQMNKCKNRTFKYSAGSNPAIILICVCLCAAQSCPTLCDPMDCSPPVSPV